MEEIKQEPGMAEKVFMLIYRYCQDGSEKSKNGQVYFMMTSAEKDRMFMNVMERLRKEENVPK